MAEDDDNNGFAQWGGYMEAKKTKLEEQFSAASDPFRQTNLFNGISIFVNGRTDPSADELKRIMMVHGGVYHHYERPHTTYIIATNLPDVKVRNMNTSKIISPQWVVDCLKAKQILDYTKYLLYTNQKTTQPRINFKKSEPNQSTLSQNGTNASILKELQTLQSKINEQQESECNGKPMLNVSATKPTSKIARTAVDPQFLQEFYNNSRLHHISTLGAGFKQYVGELRSRHGDAGFPSRQEIKETIIRSKHGCHSPVKPPTACVMHIDMDCFFVSVGLRNHPELRGMPVAVTHSKGGSAATEVPVHPQADRKAEMELFAKRFEHHLHDNIRSDKVRNGFDAKMSLSEIASCSYEARAKGIRNGMFVGAAMKLCPDLKTIPYNFEGYREVAFTLYNTVAKYTLNIEAVSCDEMFVDLTEVLSELKVAPMDFVNALRKEVREKTGCPCSAGVGANKLQARMATKRAKPDGQFMLSNTDVVEYMAPISIEELPGVGSSTAYILKQAGYTTCGNLQQASLTKLQMHLGKKLGETVYQNCRGIDNRSLMFDQVRKSVSTEVNYGIRFKSNEECETFLRQLSAEVHSRLQEIKRKTKCITLKLMVRAQDAPVETSKFMGHGVCDNITKSESLADYTNDLDKITQTVLATMKKLNIAPQELRGLGIHLSKLDEPQQPNGKKVNAIMNMFNKVSEKQKAENVTLPKTVQQRPTEVIVTATANEDSKNTSLAQQKPAGATKRGRPSKTVSSPTKVSKKQPNVLDMLQHSVPIKKTIVNDQFTENLPSDIDPEVFAELPESIRKEILAERAAQQHQQQKQPAMQVLNESDLQPSTSKAAAERLVRKTQAMPQQAPLSQRLNFNTRHIKDGISKPPLQRITTPLPPPPVVLPKEKKKEEPSKNNMFLHKDVISLLKSWVSNQNEPCDYDVDMLTKYACELVEIDQLDPLYNGMLYLCRMINVHRGTTKYCTWHLAYKMIVEAVQVTMRLLHDGKLLKLGEALKCNECKL